MPTTKTTQRPLVSLALPRPVAALITYAGQILKAMTGNPSFPSPSPTLAVVKQAVDDLQTAEAAALARTKGAQGSRPPVRPAAGARAATCVPRPLLIFVGGSALGWSQRACYFATFHTPAVWSVQ